MRGKAAVRHAYQTRTTRSPKDGLEEAFVTNRLGVSTRLLQKVRSTNLVEASFSTANQDAGAGGKSLRDAMRNGVCRSGFYGLAHDNTSRFDDSEPTLSIAL
jgi:hypothetical protein